MTFDASMRIRLTDAARRGIEFYSHEYIDSFPELLNSLKATNSTVGRAISQTAQKARKSIILSTLYNDVTLSQFNDEGGRTLSWLSEKGSRGFFGEAAKVTIPSAKKNAVSGAISRGEVGFAFSMPSSEASQQLLSDAAPLIDDGRLLIRPDRHFSYTTGERTPDGGRHWDLLTADGDADPDVWNAGGERTDETITCSDASFSTHYGKGKELIKLTNVTIPYLSGVSLSRYAEILRDENDLLIEFRSEMKKISSIDIEDIDLYRRDVLDARIAKINRKFKQISKMKALRSGGAFVATAALAVGSIVTGGAVGVVQALAGSAGLMMGAKEIADHNNQINALKDDPLYLLWKIQRA